jgi:hypothetical protein
MAARKATGKVYDKYEDKFISGHNVAAPKQFLATKQDLFAILKSFDLNRLPRLAHSTMIIGSVLAGRNKPFELRLVAKEDGTVTVIILSSKGNLPLEHVQTFLEALRTLNGAAELAGDADEDRIAIQFGKRGSLGQTANILDVAEELDEHQTIKIREVPRELVAELVDLAFRDFVWQRVSAFETDHVDVWLDEFNEDGAMLRRTYEYDEHALRASDKAARLARIGFADRPLLVRGEEFPAALLERIASFIGTRLPMDHPAMLKGSPVPATLREEWQSGASQRRMEPGAPGGRQHFRR